MERKQWLVSLWFRSVPLPGFVSGGFSEFGGVKVHAPECLMAGPGAAEPLKSPHPRGEQSDDEDNVNPPVRSAAVIL